MLPTSLYVPFGYQPILTAAARTRSPSSAAQMAAPANSLQPEAAEPQAVETHEQLRPTASHKLADADHEVKGTAQLEHGRLEDKALGWKEKAADISEPLIGGLPNEELWMLIRRFNKQIFHVKTISDVPPADLDLNYCEEEEFIPDKLRANFERLYIVFLTSLFGVWKQIVRLRSWREGKRTSIFLSVYATAWAFDILIPSLVLFLMVLILYPRFRTFCFPPAPPALIDSKTGGVKTPDAGLLASETSMTGAPENNLGEAVEQEAHSFVNSICELAGSISVGEDPEVIANLKAKTAGNIGTVDDSQTKKPVSAAVWAEALPLMHAVAHFVDTYECFGNALSPTSPFPKDKPRVILASCLVPLLFGSYFASSDMILKGFGFTVGLYIFGDPLIQRVVNLMNHIYPQWEKYVSLRNTILRGVPTNAQLTLTLLRIGERNVAPLGPSPSTRTPPPLEGHLTAGKGLDYLGAKQEEIDDAIRPDEKTKSQLEVKDRQHMSKLGSRILGLFKGTVRAGVATTKVTDRVKSHLGSKNAQDRLGAVNPGQPASTVPIRFPARFEGKKGHVHITTAATTPSLSWTAGSEDMDPAWSIAIADINEIQKIGGLGWKSKLIVGWATEHEVADGIIITDNSNHGYHLTAMPLRDGLFNRLIASGGQMWEIW